MPNPFVTPYVPSVYDSPNQVRIAELMGRQGAEAADATRRAGEIQGQMWANLGQTIAQVPGQVVAAKAAQQESTARTLQLEDAQRKRVAQKTVDALPFFASGQGRDAQLAALDGPARDLAMQHYQAADDAHARLTQIEAATRASNLNADESRLKIDAGKLDVFGALAAGVRAHSYAPEAFYAAVADAVNKQLLPMDQAGPMIAHGMQNPDWIKGTVDELIARSPAQQELEGKRVTEERMAAQARAAAADREADNQRATLQQQEIERHNKELERIGGLTAGRADKTAAETARHNGVMETIAQQNANRYGTSGIDSTMEPAYSNALGRAILSVPGTRRAGVATLANRLWSEGNTTELKDVIRQAAIESENVDVKNQVMGRIATRAALTDARSMLDELKAAGVPTNVIAGGWENILRTVGKSSDPRYAALATRLQGALINYRRAATGVQFSKEESADYVKMFPNYSNEPPVNAAILDGLMREIDTYDHEYWTHKLGNDGAKLVGVGQQRAPAAPAAAAGGGGGQPPPSAATVPGGAAPPAASAHRVGDVVTVKGQRIRVTKLLPNGQYEGVAVQ